MPRRRKKYEFTIMIPQKQVIKMLSNRWLHRTKINFVDVPQLVRFPRALEDQQLPLNGNDKCHQSYKTIPPRFGCKICRKMTEICRIVELEEKVVLLFVRCCCWRSQVWRGSKKFSIEIRAVTVQASLSQRLNSARITTKDKYSILKKNTRNHSMVLPNYRISM